jgi:hypothetical protein
VTLAGPACPHVGIGILSLKGTRPWTRSRLRLATRYVLTASDSAPPRLAHQSGRPSFQDWWTGDAEPRDMFDDDALLRAQAQNVRGLVAMYGSSVRACEMHLFGKEAYSWYQT